MPLEQYASLAEIFGFVLVIASLIYLARQLRQTSAMMRVSASNERLHRDTELGSSVIHSREVAEIWVKGAYEFDSLDEVDRQRLIFFERRALMHWHNMFWQHEQNLVPDSDWFELKWAIRNFGRRQAVRASWALFRESYQKPFRDFIEGQFEAADRDGAQSDVT